MILVYMLSHSLIGAFLLLYSKSRKMSMYISTATLFVSWLLAYLLYLQVASAESGLFTFKVNWISHWGVSLYLAADSFSMAMIMLTLFVDTVIVLSAPSLIQEKFSLYLATFFVMQTMMLGVFLAWDGFLYYIFWEAVLIPMYLCIGVWGSNMRGMAAIKFFLFTFFGSVVMLIAIVYLGLKSSSFALDHWYMLPLTFNEQILIFVAFFIAFAVKIPVWPLHTWLPDAHTEAPAGGSIILAALMLKMGGYGLLRFAWPIAPLGAIYCAPFMIVLGLIAIVYIGFVAISQTDMKKLIAYSSVAHMGFVLLGLFVVFWRIDDNATVLMAWDGAIVQMITHAFGSGALFLAFGFIYLRTKVRAISQMSGLAASMPYSAAFFLVFLFSNIAVPGTAGFVGEWMIILATMRFIPWAAFLASLTLILSATYSLVLMRRVYFGPSQSHYHDFNHLERSVCGLMVFMIFVIGLYPKLVVDYIHPTTSGILSIVQLRLHEVRI